MVTVSDRDRKCREDKGQDDMQQMTRAGIEHGLLQGKALGSVVTHATR